MSKARSPKRKLGYKKVLPITLILVLLVAGLRFALPWGMPSGQRYFDPVGARELQRDELGQFNFVYDHYSYMEITGDRFLGWDEAQVLRWRYGIAFGAYGMPSVAMISEDHRGPAFHTMRVMIEKMKSPKVWRDFVDYNMGEDPITHGNIMYKGHLNLMYGLYQYCSGDTTYEREYTWLTNRIVDEMRDHHMEGKHEGADCEPGRWFAQCNSISLLSLHLYDRLYGTNFTSEEVQWTLDFLKSRMVDEENGLYHAMYNSRDDFVDPWVSGYGNAWSLAFLRTLDPEFHEPLYQTWKEEFTGSIGPYGFVREYADGGPSPVAHLTGLLVAKEFGDVELFTKLRNSLDRKLKRDPAGNHQLYKGLNNPIYNAPVLWTKVHAGFGEILNHDWGPRELRQIPDVGTMTWVDVLPQELHLMDINAPLDNTDSHPQNPEPPDAET